MLKTPEPIGLVGDENDGGGVLTGVGGVIVSRGSGKSVGFVDVAMSLSSSGIDGRTTPADFGHLLHNTMEGVIF